MKSISATNRQSGAVSLFVVLFATLLITIVTVSFLRLMIKDQTQASNADLSQSAYDSSQAGVEDAKRALLNYQNVCATGAGACTALAAQINAAACNDALRLGNVVTDPAGEVSIQQTSNGTTDAKLDQAYTCVKIALDTPDYLGTLSAYQSRIVPLYAGGATFDTVTVEWYSLDDISTTNTTKTVSLEGVSTGQSLYKTTTWPSGRPAVMRAQFMQFGSSFTLDQFNSNVNSGGDVLSNANTLFLYPTSNVTALSRSFTTYDKRQTAKVAADAPLPIHCEDTLAAGGFACSAKLTLPNPVTGGDRTAYLRLTPFYSATHFRVTMTNGASSTVPVPFHGVQPEIDSTGRANDLFRRVKTRVELIDTTFPYPDAEIDTTGNLCKDFSLTDVAADYPTYNPVPCTP
ncbi:MAG: hypothetical protein ABIP50_00230 [Candidatus Saccharimonadales bacterium]